MENITAETMRSYNRRQIFNHIYFNKRSSRQEIADTLHLSLTTVTQNLKMLEEENLIERSGYFQSTGEPDIREGGAMVTGRICVIGSKLNEQAVAELFGTAH